MKTQRINLQKVFITLLVTLLFATSCKGQKDTEQEENPSVSKATIKPPQIDIHASVISGNSKALKQHIVAGSNLNEKDPFGGSSPLLSAAVFGKPEMAKILIEAGADLDFQNNDGSTALHSAAFFCHPEIVKMLLDKGADKTIKNKHNATPYETVVGPFSEVKGAYDMMGTMLEPMGLKLDYEHIQKTRPEIAEMLK